MIDEIKEKYEKLKNSTSLNEYTKNFREYFNVLNDTTTNTKLLEILYNDFVEQSFNQTQREKFLVRETEKVYDKIKNNLDESVKEDFEIYDFLQYKISDNYGLQSFLCGFTLANELNKATNNYVENDEILKEIIQKYKHKKGGVKK